MIGGPLRVIIGRVSQQAMALRVIQALVELNTAIQMKCIVQCLRSIYLANVLTKRVSLP